jgi:hypothetical protein
MIPLDETWRIVREAHKLWREPSYRDIYIQKHTALYNLARRLNPKMIAEIGVRRGYGAFFMLAACDDASYLGIDDDSGTHGGKPGALIQAREMLNRFDASFFIIDSKKLDRIPLEPDLIRVDGDHTYDGCYADIKLAIATHSKVVLVDDYHYISGVKKACDKWRKLVMLNPHHWDITVDDAADCMIFERTSYG